MFKQKTDGTGLFLDDESGNLYRLENGQYVHVGTELHSKPVDTVPGSTDVLEESTLPAPSTPPAAGDETPEPSSTTSSPGPTRLLDAQGDPGKFRVRTESEDGAIVQIGHLEVGAGGALAFVPLEGKENHNA